MESILVVDDEKNYTAVLNAVLEEEGFETFVANSGAKALEVIEREEIGLVITDMKMPVMDGQKATKILKAEAKTKDIPIILITAFDVADYKVIGHEAGADEFLNKPIKAPELKSRVKSLLHTKVYQDKLINLCVFLRK